MKYLTNSLIAVLALLGVTSTVLTASAQENQGVDALLEQLSDPEIEDWEKIEARVVDAWSRSGSVAMDLLLERGRDAMEADDYQAAIEHFTALTDHAPEFAEAWNMRATAFYLIDEYGLSIEDMSRALALNPKHFGALNGLGVILEQIGDDENALRAYKEAHEINPHRENVSEAIERLEMDVNGTSI